jgi:hypothetical protein
MTLLFVLTSAVVILAGVVLGYGRLVSASRPDGLDDGWYLEFDPRRYAVLTRLVSEADLAVARSWRGMDSRLENRLKRHRAAAIAAYLKEMRTDFLRLETVGRLMVLSGTTTLEFRQQLVEAKFQFTVAWWRVRVEYMLWRLGVSRVKPERLVAAFERFVTVTGPMTAAPSQA